MTTALVKLPARLRFLAYPAAMGIPALSREPDHLARAQQYKPALSAPQRPFIWFPFIIQPNALTCDWNVCTYCGGTGSKVLTIHPQATWKYKHVHLDGTPSVSCLDNKQMPLQGKWKNASAGDTQTKMCFCELSGPQWNQIRMTLIIQWNQTRPSNFRGANNDVKSSTDMCWRCYLYWTCSVCLW